MSTLEQSRLARWAVRLLIALASILVIIAVVGPEIRDPSRDINYERRSQAPSAAFPLGTDPQGRDRAWRIADGVRSTFVYGLRSAALWLAPCLAIGLLGRQLRRLSRWPSMDFALDFLIAGTALIIVIAMRVNSLDSYSEWPVLVLTLYEPSVVLVAGLSVASGVWISRTQLPMIRRAQWASSCLLVLAALTIWAEPFLALLALSPVQPPAATLGALMRMSGGYASTEWWVSLLLTVLWAAMMAVFLGGAAAIATRHAPLPTARFRRVPIYLVGGAWAIAVVGTAWHLMERSGAEWTYWLAMAVAGAGLLWCAALVQVDWADRTARMLYLTGMAVAVPLALHWPWVKLLNAIVPHLF